MHRVVADEGMEAFLIRDVAGKQRSPRLFRARDEPVWFGIAASFCHPNRPKEGEPMLRFRLDRADAPSKCPIFGTQ
jgi:hypothetical protein